MTPLAFTVNEALDVTPLSRAGLYRAMKTGELRYKKRGRRTFILADDLKQFLEHQPNGGGK